MSLAGSMFVVVSYIERRKLKLILCGGIFPFFLFFFVMSKFSFLSLTRPESFLSAGADFTIWGVFYNLVGEFCNWDCKKRPIAKFAHPIVKNAPDCKKRPLQKETTQISSTTIYRAFFKRKNSILILHFFSSDLSSWQDKSPSQKAF